MGLERIDKQEVPALAVKALGLDASAVGLMFEEGLAASLRRAASFLCPTTPGMLTRTVAEALQGLPDYSEDAQIELEGLVELLVSYGDLLELPVDTGSNLRRQLFLGPPSFVARANNSYLLMGIRSDGARLISDEFADDIEYEGHVRRLRSSGNAREVLHSEGFVEMQLEHWLRAPRPMSPQELVAAYSARLDAAVEFQNLEGFRIIDPAARVTYYKGRWRPLKPSDAGMLVGRRPQAFGADLWCVATVAGSQLRLVDLPVHSSVARGADEAWRLQAAIDVLAKRPQQVRLRQGTRSDETVLDLYSPVPSWIQRRLDLVGKPLAGTNGAFFSYAMPKDEVAEEREFLTEMMWLAVDTSSEAQT